MCSLEKKIHEEKRRKNTNIINSVQLDIYDLEQYLSAFWMTSMSIFFVFSFTRLGFSKQHTEQRFVAASKK